MLAFTLFTRSIDDGHSDDWWGAAMVALMTLHHEKQNALCQTRRNEKHQNGDAGISYPAQHVDVLNGKKVARARFGDGSEA
jgi:hypothetical protein